MLPAGLAAKAIQLCAAGLGAGGSPSSPTYPIEVHTGATLTGQPTSEADAEATVRDLLALGADFEAGPLRVNGRDFATFGVTAVTVFDVCALAHVDDGAAPASPAGAATISSVSALIRSAFGARITDTIRPTSATYGARYSWHKVGQAIDFVPAGGVTSITRGQIRTLAAASGIRLIELLGPGDRGHSTHWHIAFARPGQVIDRLRPVEGEEDWLIDVANVAQPTRATEASAALASASHPAVKMPAQWDVFAAAEWRAVQGGGS